MMVNNKEDEVVQAFLSLYRYQIVLKTPMKGSNFIFDCVDFFASQISQNKSES